MHAALRSPRERREPRTPLRPRASSGGLLLLALLALGLGVGFAGGGYGPTAAAVAVVGGLALALVAGTLAGGGLTAMLPRGASAAAVLLLALFAAWALLSVLWSVRPDLSLRWGALAAGYAAAVFVAVAAAGVSPRAREITVGGLLVVALVLGVAALVGRLSPDTGVTIGGVENATRLRGPLDYWNALGLVAAIGLLVAGRMAIGGADRRLRLALGATAPLLAGVLLLSQSRGALVALVIGALVVAACSGRSRLRMALMLGASLVASLPLTLAAGGRVVGDAVVAERSRPVVVATALLALALGALAVLAVEALDGRVRWSGRRTRILVRRGLAVLAVFVLAAAATGIAREGGVGPAVRELRDAVASSDRVAPVAGADRILSVSSSNRADWWAEAFSAWADHPVGGWGGGTFGTIRKRYREDATEVAQPHSLPLQVLSETGAVGLLLLGAALWMLLRAAVLRLRETPPSRERTLQALAIGAAAAWLAHVALDWDWELPAVTLPVLAALAAAGAVPAARGTARRADGLVTPATVADAPERLDRRARVGRRAVVLGGSFVAAVLVTVAVVLPLVADGHADRAARALSADATPEQLRDATGDAAFAAELDPFALRPLQIGVAIARQRDNLLEAQRLAVRATERQPDNPAAWALAAEVAGRLADREGMRRAARRAVELDPFGVQAVSLLGTANGQLAPPEASATATATPLPAP
ncbi:O-antigen ligase family protein [Patulibacter brassicae]|uniref:O-antigen ligase family protein n=1 Tax=Patulibacter brassicae TaxID=1705717 RepID=A0ABU4VIH7_9ACTN|nr:O-antigen ligase family protein [Patulibacter brassicae]MDX8151583.1 O-antigen ligase family protein [Patulibacter brassicae]